MPIWCRQATTRGPFQERFFHHNWNLMEIQLCSHPSGFDAITMKFCIWHNSSAVVAWTKFSSDIMTNNGVTLNHISHQIWISMEKSVNEMGPESKLTSISVTILMGQCKKDVTPLLTHWSYVFLALTHWYGITTRSELQYGTRTPAITINIKIGPEQRDQWVNV